MRAIAVCALVLALGPAAAAQAPDTLAVIHADVWNADGTTVEDATILVRDERIVSVTSGAPAPAGATVVDAGGATVTAGFVATATPLGLVEIGLESSTRHQAPEGEGVDPVRASFSASDGYDPRSTLIPVARREGVTSAIVAPVGGLIAGTAAWADLAGARPADAIHEPRLSLHVDLDDGGVGSAGGAMSAALGRLRAVLDDARLYARQRAAYDRRALRELHVSRADLERLGEALAGRIPVVVRVSRAADILRVLDLRREYGLRLVLLGAQEGWQVADRIAAADVPVIVQPLDNLPSSFSRLTARYDNAALLARAGVTIVLTQTSAHDVRTLRQEAGNAVAHGLDRDAALAAVTTAPARVFGQERDYGGLTPGAVANFVVWNGDPFEVTTWATHVVIRGRPVSMRTRQTALFERYRQLGTVRRGRPTAE